MQKSIEPVPFGLVGVGGYAYAYIRAIKALEPENLARFGAAVIRTPGKYPEHEKELAARGIPIRSSIEEMLEKDRDRFEIAAIPTGIDSHRKLMIQAVEAGFNVILEKPTTATVQDFDAMEAALMKTGRFCAIGFQSQSSETVLGLKKEICAGRLGRIREVIATGFWRRDDDYYARNSWAGRLRANGEYILDGTINNPMAHYLFNGLFFASDRPGQAALPVSVRAELYHAHRIESEDTSCLEVDCDNGARVYFYGTLCASANQPIVIEVIGEKGRAIWSFEDPVKFYEGDKEVFQLPGSKSDPRVNIFRNVVRVHRGLDRTLNCPLAMTRAHVLAVNGAFKSAGRTVAIPERCINFVKDPEGDSRFSDIVGIEDIVQRAVQERKLFSDLKVEWAVPTQPFSLKGLTKFSL